VIRQLAPERPAALEYSTDAPSATGLVAAAAAVRGAAVALSGLILAAGLAMVLWAVTPSSGAEMAAEHRDRLAARRVQDTRGAVVGAAGDAGAVAAEGNCLHGVQMVPQHPARLAGSLHNWEPPLLPFTHRPGSPAVSNV